MRLRALALILLIAGCVAPTPPAASPVTLVWSRDLAFGADNWRREANQRFGRDAVVVICHGSEDGGEWRYVPDPPQKGESVQALGVRLRQLYPRRPIVLITCNPGGFDLHGLPGVYYARRDVVIPPYANDSSVGKRWRTRAAGTIWELADHP